MNDKKNMAASGRQRLLNRARADKRPFAELLQYYAMERFLFRLSQSEHAGKFILKGALLLRTWGAAIARPTMDIDLSGRTSNDISAIPANPAVFIRQFVEEKQDQWKAYLRRMSETTAPSDFGLIMAQVQAFVEPVLQSILSSNPLGLTWKAPGQELLTHQGPLFGNRLEPATWRLPVAKRLLNGSRPSFRAAACPGRGSLSSAAADFILKSEAAKQAAFDPCAVS